MEETSPDATDTKVREIMAIQGAEEQDGVTQEGRRSEVGVGLEAQEAVGAEEAFLDACIAGDEATVAAMLADPAFDPTRAVTDLQQNAIHVACGHDSQEVVRLLLQDGRVDPNRKQVDGSSPLHYSWCCKEIVQLLLEDGRVDVNALNEELKTALHIAIEEVGVAVVELLLRDPRVDFNVGLRTPLTFACEFCPVEVVEWLLQDPRTNINEPNDDGFTPLFFVCQADWGIEPGSGAERIARMMLKNPELDVNIANRRGTTPLLAACEMENTTAIRLLLEKGADVNLADDEGMTPLWQATFQGKIEPIKLILASSTEIATQARCLTDWDDTTGLTAAEIAREIEGLFETTGMSALIDEYTANPVAVSARLRQELGWPTRGAYLFGSLIFLCDGFIRLGDTPATWKNDEEREEEDRIRRFLQIGARLHLDLQMLLSNRACGSMKDSITLSDREVAFKALAKNFSS